MASSKIPPAAKPATSLKCVRATRSDSDHNPIYGTPINAARMRVPGLELSANEITLVLRFRAIADEGRDALLPLVAGYAKEYPRPAHPNLRVISGGAA